MRRVSVMLGRPDEHEPLGAVFAQQPGQIRRLTFAVSAPMRPEKQEHRTALEFRERLWFRAQPLVHFKRRRRLSLQAQQVNVLLDTGTDGSVGICVKLGVRKSYYSLAPFDGRNA